MKRSQHDDFLQRRAPSLKLSNCLLLGSTATMTTCKWFDERPFEECIMDAEPSENYLHIIQCIEADPRVFATPSTIYDLEITLLTKKLEPLSKNYKELVKKQEELLTSPKKNQKLIEESILETRSLRAQITGIEAELQKINGYQDLARKEYISLNRVAKLYVETGSRDVLLRGVEWVCSYADALRKRQT